MGYGYLPWLAAFWLSLLLFAGNRVFEHAYPGEITAAKKPEEIPEFHSVIYTLDLLLPIVNLGQESSYIPHGATARWSWGLILAGWLLTTAVVAGLTGVFKKD